MALQERVYLERDNAIKLGLLADGKPVEASSLTRAVVKLTDNDGNTFSFDSDVDGSTVIDFTSEQAQVSDAAGTSILVLKLQNASTPPTARDDYQCDIILYDTVNINGIHWGDSFPVRVISG